MDWAKREFDRVDDGTVFLVDHHSVARGRQGREWKLYPGQLLVTFVVKPVARQKVLMEEKGMPSRWFLFARCVYRRCSSAKRV